jgi:hypothetical protein
MSSTSNKDKIENFKRKLEIYEEGCNQGIEGFEVAKKKARTLHKHFEFYQALQDGVKDLKDRKHLALHRNVELTRTRLS